MKHAKTSLKKILFAALFFSATFLYADSWFVCLSSYHNKDNAISEAQKIQRKGLNVFVKAFSKNENEIIYRVFLNESFPLKNDALARKEILENDYSFSALGLNGLWCVQLPFDQAIQKPKTVKPKKVEAVKKAPVTPELPEIVEISIIEEVPVEKIVEVIREITVEKIVQVVKEVPVEVIKEVPVERIIEVIKEVPVSVQPENTAVEVTASEVPVTEAATDVDAEAPVTEVPASEVSEEENETSEEDLSSS